MKVILALLFALLYGLLPVHSSLSVAAAPLIVSGGNSRSIITLTQADNGKSVVLHVGQTAVITLQENPTTGYQWAVEPSPKPLLILTSSAYTTAAKPGLVGAGGQRVLRFQARRSGTDKLQLKLWRAWEGNRSIVDRFAITVIVQR